MIVFYFVDSIQLGMDLCSYSRQEERQMGVGGRLVGGRMEDGEDGGKTKRQAGARMGMTPAPLPTDLPHLPLSPTTTTRHHRDIVDFYGWTTHNTLFVLFFTKKARCPR